MLGGWPTQTLYYLIQMFPTYICADVSHRLNEVLLKHVCYNKYFGVLILLNSFLMLYKVLFSFTCYTECGAP